MCTFNSKSEKIYKNVMQDVLDDLCGKKLDNYYFLINKREVTPKYFSLSKITFRNELILNLKNDLKEEECFGLIFNNSEVLHKKSKKKIKEDQLIEKLKSSNFMISNEKIIEKLNILLKFNRNKSDITIKENNLHSLQNSYSFYDDIFSKDFYTTEDNYDFQISKQLNGLYILSLCKYSNFFFNILNDLKGSNDKNFKLLIKENVKIEYDQRLIKADTSGKKKRNTIFINENMTILQIIYKNKPYKIRSKIKGFHCDINENLIANPHILFMSIKDSWILILKHTNQDLQKCITPDEYQQERKDLIYQYNILFDSFEKSSL
ncbi:hypothetical protein MKS88_005280 [Plasmodium brasilianum]|uniref:Uncharacterized protein n=2 Tax=Plasmodium (Plasmodium) TaxID=418103 RepID=A0A1A8WLZ3_PLAMA|nr:hypothetical protein MKS88_005280 [Plasmodium brasilianum]SBS93937.1 conserved Plasmodium protein, unknown function [Plasmodium malariae]